MTWQYIIDVWEATALHGFEAWPCIAAADHALSAADLNNLCRCFPDFDSALLADVVTAVGLKAYNGSSTLYSSTFGSASQRLQRYIADIHKGILIILVSGMCPAPPHMAL